ncbi:type II toxin-antitoxin system prevent-host-death family antitoxin [candidate division KSB3 bacterium]|uniref:Antitoxin n=1 Tax=candidate division KSB3 bacterium TaxID=2044937 RepID=A0A2G6KM20_9BACT|nr:MAG: type II toxin-antitoxin system prevent-host-death family antitoxin [candidate division KSB3 bacterium]
MHTSWKLQDAKAQFSQVVNDAIALGPQRVTRRGKEVVVILSTEEYENITSNKPTLKEFLLTCPKIDDDFEFERQKDYSRNIEF